MPNDLVSVIVPTYNRAYCILDTIKSVVAQTHSNWEILLVDDGSSDETAQLIAAEYGHDPRIRYIYQHNAGVSHARNTGLDQARGDYVAFLDSDDTWKRWKLEVQLVCLQRFPEVGMVWTNMEAVDPDGKVIDPRHMKTMYSAYKFFDMDELFERSMALAEITPAAGDHEAQFYIGDIYPAMISGGLVHTSTVLMSRERMKLVNGFDESLKLSGEDYDFHLRTCKWGAVGLIDVASIQYQKGRADHLSNNSNATAANFLTTVKRAIEDDVTVGRFPAERVMRVLAEAHGWVAEERFKDQDARGARRHALHSLRYRPFQLRLIGLLAASCLPRATTQALISIYRHRSFKKRTEGNNELKAS